MTDRTHLKTSPVTRGTYNTVDTACGRGTNAAFATANIARVTCKNCLKAVAARRKITRRRLHDDA